MLPVEVANAPLLLSWHSTTSVEWPQRVSGERLRKTAMRIGHLLVHMYGAKHTVPVAHIIIVSTLGNCDRDAVARFQQVANVRFGRVSGIF